MNLIIRLMIKNGDEVSFYIIALYLIFKIKYPGICKFVVQDSRMVFKKRKGFLRVFQTVRMNCLLKLYNFSRPVHRQNINKNK